MMRSLLAIAAKQLIFGWMTKMASKAFMEWAIFGIAEAYTKSTKTKMDDKKLKEFKAFMKG